MFAPAFVVDKAHSLTILPSIVAVGNNPAPLPPSVEEAYRKKCIELKRRMTEVEESNDAFRLRKVRLTRAIRKMRLERAYLLETLGKRMRKNGGSNEMNGFLDEESEGSSEGPPTPHEKPLRSKRSHRRTGPSHSTPNENNKNSSNSNDISTSDDRYRTTSAFHAYEPRRDVTDADVEMQSPTSGQQPATMQDQHLSHPSAEGRQQEDQLSSTRRPSVPPLPPPSAFQMYADERFLSPKNADTDNENKTPEALMRLAHEAWDTTESEGVKQYYLLQESKAKENYETKVAAVRQYENDMQGLQEQEQEEGRQRQPKPRRRAHYDDDEDGIEYDDTEEEEEEDNDRKRQAKQEEDDRLRKAADSSNGRDTAEAEKKKDKEMEMTAAEKVAKVKAWAKAGASSSSSNSKSSGGKGAGGAGGAGGGGFTSING